VDRGFGEVPQDTVSAQERLEALERRLQRAWEQAADTALAGYVRAEPALEAMGSAVENLHVAAEEVGAAARLVRAQRQRYEELFQLAPGGYVVTDTDDVIAEANEEASLMLTRGASPLGRVFAELTTGAHRQTLRQLVEEARRVAPETTLGAPIELRPAPGQPTLHVQAHCRAALGPDGELIGYRWMLHDLTERMQTEQLRREIADRDAEHLRELSRNWEAVESAKSQFLQLASHELRSPLTVIGGYLSMLNDGTLGPLPETVLNVVELLVAKTREMNALVNEMLEAARLDEVGRSVVAVEMDLVEVVRQVIDDWRPLLPARHRVVLELPDERLMVSADFARVRTIVANLVHNAIKFSPDGGDIVCRVYRYGTNAAVEVADSGIGLSEEDLAVLFTRFGRVVNSRSSNIGGTGLGLYVSRELARAQGGDITAASRESGGSVFSLTVPLAEVLATTAQPLLVTVRRSALSSEPAPRGGGPRTPDGAGISPARGEG